MDIDLIGGGKGILASDGKYVEITWTKQKYDSQFSYTLKDGSATIFAPGTSYICIVDSDLEANIS
jgi:hypothetical protein